MFLLRVVIPLHLLVLFADHLMCSQFKVAMAPIISQHPKSELAYKPGEDITIDCIANADSNALYEWKKDGRHLNMNGTTMMMSSGSGSIVIKAPSEENDGVYQCFVRNQFGTAVSSKATVRKAVLDPFPSVFEPMVKSPVVGESLSLRCLPPMSYPKGTVYWGINSDKLEAIENTDRIILDYEGNLHFANVVPDDSLGGTSYVTIVHNALLGAYVQGNDHKITPVVTQGSPTQHSPQLLWSSPPIEVALKGQTKRIKCIFSGLPTPEVTWRRLGHGRAVGSRAVMTPSGRGTELEITNVELEDAGLYECSASNSKSETKASKNITVIVESAPFWSQERSPSNIQTEEDSDVEINCQAYGTPAPNMSFLINGVPVGELPPNSRRGLSGHRIIYKNVTTSDSHVIQCIAANKHGTILTNIIVSVTAAPPSFIETPPNAKVVEGQSVMFRCHASGAPKPVITWSKGKSMEPVSGDRFVVHPSGILEIHNASVSDSDVFHCHAVNKFGTDDLTVNLTVRSVTKILPEIEKVAVNVSQDVVLPCEIRADPLERSNLVVEWRKNNQTIDFSKENHLRMHPTEFSLKINRSRVSDSANFSCHVRSSVDATDSLPISLTVSDRPDPPYDVMVSTCAAKYAIVSWKVGSSNNDPQLEFLVFYNDSVNGTDRLVEGANVTANGRPGFVQGQDERVVVFGIRPWSVYSFHVVARNLIGVSDRSLPSQPCVTLQMVPERNPGGVCSKRKGPTQLVIVWEEIFRPDWNGEGFHYIVSYRPLHSTEAVKSRMIEDPKQTELEIHDRSTFDPYEIFVQSANNIGITQISETEKRIGYSGEGKPLDSPTNFQLVNLTSTYGEFSWNAVDVGSERLRGFFQGYRIKFWRSFDRDSIREEDVIIVTDIDLCPSLDDHKKRFVRSFDKISGSTNRLWPYSVITAGVMVINHAYPGPLSNTVEFQTPEGVPGQVSSVVVIERGSSHLRVKWDIPEEPNGIVIGYEISYQVALPAVGRLQSVYSSGTEHLLKKLFNLEFSTAYVVSVSAVTGAGSGESTFVFGETLPSGDPDRPAIENIETGDESANVTWSPSIHLVPVNLGHSFYLRFKLKGENQWTDVSIDPEATENWINVTDLHPGSYEFQIVAVNGFDDLTRENKSSVTDAFVGPEVDSFPADPNFNEKENNATFDEVTGLAETAPVFYEKASQSYWFIVLICIVIFLILVLLIVCVMRYMRGDVYLVSKKEQICGHDPYAPEDVPFGEYKRRNSNSSKNDGSEISIESDEKAIESDSYSLEEYDETDPTKFTEDGSFIGLYTGKKRGQRPDSENLPSSALDTVV